MPRKTRKIRKVLRKKNKQRGGANIFTVYTSGYLDGSIIDGDDSHLNLSWFGRALPGIISSVPEKYTTIDIHHYDPTTKEHISDSDVKTKLTDIDRTYPRVKSTFHRENIPFLTISEKHPDFKNYIIINGTTILTQSHPYKPKEFILEDDSKVSLNAILVSTHYQDYFFNSSSNNLFLVNSDGTVTTYLERAIIKKWIDKPINTNIVIDAYLKELYPAPSNMTTSGYSKMRSDAYDSIVERNMDNNTIIRDRLLNKFYNKIWDDEFTYPELIKEIKDEVIKNSFPN